jgi:hypothetical protein
VRLQLEGTEARLAVLDGALRVDGPSGEIDVPRKKTVTFSMAGSTEPTVTREVAANDFDSWDRNEADYHSRFAQMSALSSSPYSYGTSDMAYYGNFANVDGCGTMWRPYFASAGWDPYSNGAWAYYEGAGYSWVSPYPWGWMPYHYGTWNFCSGAGWGWMPGGSWTGLNNTAIASVNAPPAPTRPPRKGEPALTAVNLKPVVQSELDSSSKFVFRKDSAGLGIPRDELGKLDKFSQHAAEKGTASTPVYFESTALVAGSAHATSTAEGVPTMHRGSPPAAPESASAAFAGTASASTNAATTTSSAPSASHGGSSSGGSHH